MEYVIKAYQRDMHTKEFKKDKKGKKISYYYETLTTSAEKPENFTYDLRKAKRFEFVSDSKAEAKKKAIAKYFKEDHNDYFIVKLK